MIKEKTKPLLIAESAVQRQMAAIGGELFEFGIKEEATGIMVIRKWSRQKAMKSVGWLRYKNIRGHHIYIRPFGSSGIALVDDLGLGTLTRMEEDGVVPSCVVETSSFNYQAWVRVSDKPIPPTLGSAVGRLLQQKFDGDPNSADWRHFGRAAGFTNQKPEHVMDNGFYPFVKLRSTKGGVTSNAAELLDQARILLIEKEEEEKRLAERERMLKRHRGKNMGAKIRPTEPVESAYKAAIEYTLERYHDKVDESRVDFAVVKHLVYMGYSRTDIESVMVDDTRIARRKKGHVDDYIRRTLDAAIKD